MLMRSPLGPTAVNDAVNVAPPVLKTCQKKRPVLPLSSSPMPLALLCISPGPLTSRRGLTLVIAEPELFDTNKVT